MPVEGMTLVFYLCLGLARRGLYIHINRKHYIDGHIKMAHLFVTRIIP